MAGGVEMNGVEMNGVEMIAVDERRGRRRGWMTEGVIRRWNKAGEVGQDISSPVGPPHPVSLNPLPPPTNSFGRPAGSGLRLG